MHELFKNDDNDDFICKIFNSSLERLEQCIPSYVCNGKRFIKDQFTKCQYVTKSCSANATENQTPMFSNVFQLEEDSKMLDAEAAREDESFCMPCDEIEEKC